MQICGPIGMPQLLHTGIIELLYPIESKKKRSTGPDLIELNNKIISLVMERSCKHLQWNEAADNLKCIFDVMKRMQCSGNDLTTKGCPLPVSPDTLARVTRV